MQSILVVLFILFFGLVHVQSQDIDPVETEGDKFVYTKLGLYRLASINSKKKLNHYKDLYDYVQKVNNNNQFLTRRMTRVLNCFRKIKSDEEEGKRSRISMQLLLNIEIIKAFTPLSTRRLYYALKWIDSRLAVYDDKDKTEENVQLSYLKEQLDFVKSKYELLLELFEYDTKIIHIMYARKVDSRQILLKINEILGMFKETAYTRITIKPNYSLLILADKIHSEQDKRLLFK